MIRVVFRFLFIVPILIVGVDGVRPHHRINEVVFWTGKIQTRLLDEKLSDIGQIFWSSWLALVLRYLRESGRW